jgi:PAS domain S-box-containing protein
VNRTQGIVDLWWRGWRRLTEPVSNLSLAAKGVVVVAIPICGLLGAMGIFYRFEQQMRYADRWVTHTYEVRADIARVLTLAGDAQAGVRGYLLTRQEAFLGPYLNALAQLPGSLANLRRLVSDSPDQLARLSRVESLISAHLALLEDLRGRPPAKAGVSSLEGDRARMDELRRQLNTMRDEEEQLLVKRRAAAQRAEQNVQRGIFLGGVFGLLGGLIAALIFTQGIARRIQQLEHAAHEVAAGRRIGEEVTGDDEIARLARTLKNTSDLVISQSAQLRKAHAELEMRVEQRTAELHAANEQLRQANEIRGAVVQSSPLAIWVVDLIGNVLFWNTAAERIFGWTEAEVIGKPLPVIPADQQAEYRQWLERLRSAESIAGVERKRRKKDGSLIDVEIWTSPLRDETGAIRGAIAIDQDVSQQKLLEEQFRQAQKLEAVGRLAGGIAHDFNNLLTVIAGYAEMLAGEIRDPNLREYGEEIQYAAERATSLTAQLLTFSRRQITQPCIIDLSEAVAHSMKLFRRVIGEDIEIETRLDPHLGRIKADPLNIDQVIMNLVVNARDAMRYGGRLTIETANRELDEQYAGRHIGVPPGLYSMLAVSDTGVGMSPEVRSRIFEPFFTTKESGKGTGLGLSIVYGIVKQNGGEIIVYSEPGQGTSFKLYFPMVELPSELISVEAGTEKLRGRETVLVCEDEAVIRKLVNAMLSKYGYRVIEAENVVQAVDIASDGGRQIDLLVTDVVMPDANGFELAKAVRKLRPDVKVLYMSGYADSHLARNSELDAPLIQKPFSASSLTRKVREALGGASAA